MTESLAGQFTVSVTRKEDGVPLEDLTELDSKASLERMLDRMTDALFEYWIPRFQFQLEGGMDLYEASHAVQVNPERTIPLGPRGAEYMGLMTYFHRAGFDVTVVKKEQVPVHS